MGENRCKTPPPVAWFRCPDASDPASPRRFSSSPASSRCSPAARAPALADGVGPLSIAKRGHFFVGGKYVDSKDGPVLAGQAYVEYYIPTNRTQPLPDRDDRGLLPRRRRLHGHARRPRRLGPVFPRPRAMRSTSWIRSAAAARPMSRRSTGAKTARSPQFVERDFINYAKYNLFPQAKLHTQWPGSGTIGDPVFDQFMAETHPMIGDAKIREAVNRDAIDRAARPDRPGDPDAAFAVRRAGVAGGGCAAAAGQGAADGRGRHLVVLRGQTRRPAELVRGRPRCQSRSA